MNRLKVLAAELGIAINSGTGRRSCVAYSLAAGMDPQAVAQLTGHKGFVRSMLGAVVGMGDPRLYWDLPFDVSRITGLPRHAIAAARRGNAL